MSEYDYISECLEGARNGRLCAGAEKGAAEIKRLTDALEQAQKRIEKLEETKHAPPAIEVIDGVISDKSQDADWLRARYFEQSGRIEQFTDALDHIMRVCRNTDVQTKRLLWIEKRAQCAIEGSDDWREYDYPKVRKAAKENGELRERIEQLEAALHPGKQACDCCTRQIYKGETFWMIECQCGNHDDIGQAQAWCSRANAFEGSTGTLIVPDTDT